MIFLWILLGVLTFTPPLTAKVRLLTFHCNRPDFIELQHKCCEKFILDDYELIVFNDARTSEMEQQIREICQEFEIQCIRFEPEWHFTDPLNLKIKKWVDDPINNSHIGFNKMRTIPNLFEIADQPSVRHSHVIQYALDHFGYNHDDLVALIDGDLFPVRHVSLRDLLEGYDMIGIERWSPQPNVGYFWVPFVAFNPKTLPNITSLQFNVSLIGNFLHDTGAQSHYYLRDNPTIKAKKFPYKASTEYKHWSDSAMRQDGYKDAEIGLIRNLPSSEAVEFHIGKNFLHFGASSFELMGHQIKSYYVDQFLTQILIGL
jgi:hypothetical protein